MAYYDENGKGPFPLHNGEFCGNFHDKSWSVKECLPTTTYVQVWQEKDFVTKFAEKVISFIFRRKFAFKNFPKLLPNGGPLYNLISYKSDYHTYIEGKSKGLPRPTSDKTGEELEEKGWFSFYVDTTPEKIKEQENRVIQNGGKIVSTPSTLKGRDNKGRICILDNEIVVRFPLGVVLCDEAAKNIEVVMGKNVPPETRMSFSFHLGETKKGLRKEKVVDIWTGE